MKLCDVPSTFCVDQQSLSISATADAAVVMDRYPLANVVLSSLRPPVHPLPKTATRIVARCGSVHRRKAR